MDEEIFSEEDNAEIMEGMDEYHKELEEDNRRDSELMESVKKMVSKKVFKMIEEELEESEGGFGFEIVKEPMGENQKNKDSEFWVNQTTNGGYSGDTYEGSCYFKIGENKYLRWNYAM